MHLSRRFTTESSNTTVHFDLRVGRGRTPSLSSCHQKKKKSILFVTVPPVQKHFLQASSTRAYEKIVALILSSATGEVKILKSELAIEDFCCPSFFPPQFGLNQHFFKIILMCPCRQQGAFDIMPLSGK